MKQEHEGTETLGCAGLGSMNFLFETKLRAGQGKGLSTRGVNTERQKQIE